MNDLLEAAWLAVATLPEAFAMCLPLFVPMLAARIIVGAYRKVRPFGRVPAIADHRRVAGRGAAGGDRRPALD